MGFTSRTFLHRHSSTSLSSLFPASPISDNCRCPSSTSCSQSVTSKSSDSAMYRDHEKLPPNVNMSRDSLWCTRCDRTSPPSASRSALKVTSILFFVVIILLVAIACVASVIRLSSPSSSDFLDTNSLENDLPSQRLFHPKFSSQSSSWNPLVTGVYWSQEVEDMMPEGFGSKDLQEWANVTHKSQVVKVEDGCGRLQNRLITLETGDRSCCRYRQNMDQIQGEIFSYYLGRLLGIKNLPPTSLNLVRPKDHQWRSVKGQLSLAQWREDRPIVMTKWVHGLSPAFIPEPFQAQNRHLHPPDVNLKSEEYFKDPKDLIELVQWSDLILFDYLTGNLDRVVNNLYNMKWNPNMMHSPAHNLAVDSATGLLIFFDNESGLLHGYRLLQKYEPYHLSLLESLCIFRSGFIERLRLLRDEDISEKLHSILFNAHPEMELFLPPLPAKNIGILKERINTVLNQVDKCQRIYG